MRLRLLVTLSVLVAVTLCAQAPTYADSWFNVTECDTTSVRGLPAEHVTFQLHNLDHTTIYQFAIAPDHSMPQDTCHVFLATAPAGWVAQPTGDGVIWTVQDLNTVVRGGGVLDGLTVTTSRPSCCFLAEFASPLGVFDAAPFCVICPLATPARSSTWGELKVEYR